MLSASSRQVACCLFALALVLDVAASRCSAQPRAAAATPTWRTDYNTARKEAQQKNLPIFVVISTDNCFYCRKLEATTFRDPGIEKQLTEAFIPLKIDANNNPELAKALRVQAYPTMVLAGADGKIHAFLEGYLDAERLDGHLKRAIAASTTTDWMARDFNEASKAIGTGEYPRAVTLLKGIIAGAVGKPVGAKSQELLDGIEKQAAGRLARAKEFETKGQTPEAMDTLAELMKTYAGTQAATDAATLMAGLADRPETLERQRARQARDLLALSRDDFRAGRYHDCLQRCDQLRATFGDRAESKEAAALADEIKSNPDRLAAACEQMNEKTAQMYLALADSWTRRGQTKEAIACLEKVRTLSPNSRHAELAQTQITRLRGDTSAIPTGFKKP
jgi:thioredoxin-related protein